MQVVVREPIQWVLEGELGEYLHKNKEYTMGFGSPLARYAIVPTLRNKSDEYHFIWTTHHAIYDGWSMNLILKEVDQQYQSLKSDSQRKEASSQLPLSKLSLNFNVFIKALQEIDIKESDTFWYKQFEGGEPKTFPRSQSRKVSSPTAFLESTFQYTRKGRPDLTMFTIVVKL